MPARTKLSLKAYAAWNYQQEVDDLNKASAEGWQLQKGGCFHSRFVYEPDICYRYQIDCQKVSDMPRYLEFFREQGWEYVNTTFNGWSYFRKPYDPSLPEEEYEIFTDRESLTAMTGRWGRFAVILGSGLLLFALLCAVRTWRHPRWPMYVDTVYLLVLAALMLVGGLRMRQGKNRASVGGPRFMALFLVFVILGNAAVLLLNDYRPNIRQSSQGTVAGTQDIMLPCQVSYRDFYEFEFSLKADAPLTAELVNESGACVWYCGPVQQAEETERLRLPKGLYHLRVSGQADFDIRISLD